MEIHLSFTKKYTIKMKSYKIFKKIKTLIYIKIPIYKNSKWYKTNKMILKQNKKMIKLTVFII